MLLKHSVRCYGSRMCKRDKHPSILYANKLSLICTKKPNGITAKFLSQTILSLDYVNGRGCTSLVYCWSTTISLTLVIDLSFPTQDNGKNTNSVRLT